MNSSPFEREPGNEATYLHATCIASSIKYISGEVIYRQTDIISISSRPMDSKATSARTTGAEGTDFPDSEPPDSDSGPPDSDLGMGMDVIVEEAGDLWGRGSLRKQSSYEAAMEGGDVELEEREEEREEEEMVVDFIHDKEPFPVSD